MFSFEPIVELPELEIADSQAFTHKLDSDSNKYYSAVISIPGDDDRLSDFYNKWDAAWPNQTIHTHLCFKNSPTLRSMGVFACFYQILATFMHLQNRDSFDYVLLFEDDGVPFPDTVWPDDLKQRFDSDPEAEMILLGGHRVTGKGLNAIQGDELLYKAADSSGSYGVAIRASTAEMFMKGLGEELARKVDDKSGLDRYLWYVYGDKGRISVPLLVDHRPGKSSTWGSRPPSRRFQGRREFWKFDD